MPSHLQTVVWASALLSLPSASMSAVSARNAAAAAVAAAGPPDLNTFEQMLYALKVMQDQYYEPWVGTWPDAIDWTAAVMGSHVAGALNTLSKGLDPSGISSSSPPPSSGLGLNDDLARENLIGRYFDDAAGFYFGQDAFAVRGQAYDDMQWVVLEWLDTIRFIDGHSQRYFGGPQSSKSSAERRRRSDSSSSSSSRRERDNDFSSSSSSSTIPSMGPSLTDTLAEQTYHGKAWTAAYAHRARIFWDLVEQGWDTDYCGGGMNWNPRLLMYKNAITNELFVSSSIDMYLYFPGDDIASPFSDPCREKGSWPSMSSSSSSSSSSSCSNDSSSSSNNNNNNNNSSSAGASGAGDIPPQPARDPKYLSYAMSAYRWLQEVGMLNDQGLYIDGFHISGFSNKSDPNTKCDQPNNMIYTYNQGVVLSGLVGLWKATGDSAYLDDGHDLVRSVVAATGWDLAEQKPVDDVTSQKGRSTQAAGDDGNLPPWRGLGRAGVLEDKCDVAGDCSQNSHTFKGIYMHHLAYFCRPLGYPADLAPQHGDKDESRRATTTHRDRCASYLPWLAHNARAAALTRDAKGRFGTWWTAGLLGYTAGAQGGMTAGEARRVSRVAMQERRETNGTDYRTFGIPDGGVWGDENGALEGTDRGNNSPHDTASSRPPSPVAQRQRQRQRQKQKPVHLHVYDKTTVVKAAEADAQGTQAGDDPNERGRGRTVETQGSGLAVLRALWEIANPA